MSKPARSSAAEDLVESLADALGVDDEVVRGRPEWAVVAAGHEALQRLAKEQGIEVAVVAKQPHERQGWEGDLQDDCLLRRGRYAAHCERLHPGRWYASVDLGRETVYHSGEAGMSFATGGDARRFCEWFICNELGRRRP